MPDCNEVVDSYYSFGFNPFASIELAAVTRNDVNALGNPVLITSLPLERGAFGIYDQYRFEYDDAGKLVAVTYLPRSDMEETYRSSVSYDTETSTYHTSAIPFGSGIVLELRFVCEGDKISSQSIIFRSEDGSMEYTILWNFDELGRTSSGQTPIDEETNADWVVEFNESGFATEMKAGELSVMQLTFGENAEGQPASVKVITDPDSVNEYAWKYSESGALVEYSEKYEHFYQGEVITGSTTGYCFDESGAVYATFDIANTPGGYVKTTDYYDENGNITKTTIEQFNKDGVLSSLKESTIEYDEAGNKIHLLTVGESYDENGNAVFLTKQEETFQYDESGMMTYNLVVSYNEDGTVARSNATTYHADGSQVVVETTFFSSSGGRKVTTTYDADGRRVDRKVENVDSDGNPIG